MMRPLEGFFASSNPYAVQVAGPVAFRAGSDGVTVARFGWGNYDTGLVNNTRSKATDVLGYIFPVINGNSAVRTCRGVRSARPGVGVSLMRNGDYWVRFPGGASVGQPVYASGVDGTPVSGFTGSAEATPWFVVTDTAPGGLAIISTTCKVTL